jgi:YbbR domain-containing protein
VADRPALLHNLGMKIVALAIALIVWFVFSAQRKERISERSYRIPLSVVNIPPQMTIASPLPTGVEVRIRGPFTPLRQLDPSKIEAVIDLSDAQRGERIYRLAPEDINVPQEVEVLAISPSEVRILLDTTSEKEVPITPTIAGTPAPGFETYEVQSEPRVARVVGPGAALAEMDHVSTDAISIADRSATLSVPATVRVDAPGVRIREGQVVTVTVRIRPVEAAAALTPTPAGKRRK